MLDYNANLPMILYSLQIARQELAGIRLTAAADSIEFRRHMITASIALMHAQNMVCEAQRRNLAVV